ncbi:DNA mismatch repair endonuclease MutL [Leptodesmis sichuanensis]|uniref:DNA mismatch repair endonuclease MutL n=1 Tax=Leptodesmis sichuanensis TaxID=2906798 RepID=UPI001F41D5B7|nr:DNA mismatch repair endonuclease MutL [Leptodesmis sichuanensis]UIE39720.1 DNA mismatch repair endonuclease MutL [Leptodesmis sichuanensis A121]
MQSGIEPLPVEVVHLIAAGEVIDSLAAVVRELAENALDAGATRITIALWPDQWRVRVADNGTGMGLQDLQQAASPHSTSKIRDRADLWHITSLGFRGEALYSLAQLAELTIASRPIAPAANGSAMDLEAGEGWLVTYNSLGEAVQTRPVAIAPGTIVTVEQLFANLPARRQGLPSFTQQLKAVQATIHQLALGHPHVTWQVQQNERDWFTLFPGATAREILPQVLRDVQVHDLRELEVDVQPVENGSLSTSDSFLHSCSLYVLLGLPDRCHRHRADWIRVALNGRFVHLPELEQAILTGFRRTLPRDRYPVCIVQLRVPPEQVDWNRHPAKSEVYLHNLKFWCEQILAAIAQTLQLNSNTLPESFHANRLGQLLKTAETAGDYSVAQSESETEAKEPIHQSSGLKSLKAIAQVHQTYILAEHAEGIWLLEQHIVHERVLYEQLVDRWQIVPLPTPIILNQLTPAQVEQLQRLGLEVEAFGEQTWVVRSVPEMVAHRQDCAEALLELSLGGDLPTAQAAIACRSAIRNGTPLTLSEMQTLLDQWQQTRNPRTCPHGRPICLTLSESSLSRFFRRHWMIGKSHGL